MFNDLRYALRMLLKSPGFTTVAVLTLALGIGANTAIFSLIDAVLVKMLPVRNPQELVLLEVANGQEIEKTFSSPLYRTLRDHNQVFSGMFASSGFLLDLTTDDQTGSKLTGELVSGSYFSVLGVSPILGRVLTTEDERAVGMYPVAVISYGLWQERFALNPSVVGQTITLNRTPFTVVGVTPSEFFGESVDRLSQVWLPMTMQPQISGGNSSLEDIRVEWLTVMGRLKSRVGLEQARANLNVLFRQYQAEVAGNIKNAQAKQELLNQRIELVSGSKGFSELRERFSQPFLTLMTVVGLVLLVACANVANLLLARAAARQKEISVRLAVGAGRIRLIRQLLTESLLLALTGGAFGLLLAWWGSHAVSNLLLSNPTPIPRSLDPSWRILGFTSAVSLLTGILFGLVPALRTTQIDLNMALKDSSRGLSNMRSRLGWRGVLVISQVAVSLLLLIGAGLFVRSLQKLRSLDAGFERHNVLTLMIDPERGGYTAKQLGNLYQELLERLKSLPGVRAAGLSQNSLFTGNDIGLCCASVPGYLPRPGENRYVRFDIVSPGFFSTVGMPILLGRDFDARDREGASKTVVVNEALVRHYFRDQNPLGGRFAFEGGGHTQQYEIVGIVKDAKYNSLREETSPFLYLPFSQNSNLGSPGTLVVRTLGDPLTMVNAVRREVKAIAQNVSIVQIKTLDQAVEESLIQERLMAKLSSSFGLLALLLACVGLYGVMSYAVARRTSEIGIRVALGAREQDVLWLVLRETLLLVTLGITIGLPVALASTRLISSRLFGLTPMDPVTISASTLLLAAVAALAGYLPARRATKVDPMVALRYE